MYSKEFIKNVWIMRVLVFTAYAAIAIFCLTGCRMVDLSKGSKETSDISTESIDETITANTAKFDNSIIENETQGFGWKPIDPSKFMEVRNINGGTISLNAEKVHSKTKTKKSNNIKETGAETKKKTTDIENENTTKETWLDKHILSMPPFNFFVIGLFLFFVWYLYGTKKTARTTLSALEEIKNKINN